MGEVRKSEFTGDRFGDWIVTGRAPAQNRKRAWLVLNEQTDERKTVLQTDLGGLGEATQGLTSPWSPPVDIWGLDDENDYEFHPDEQDEPEKDWENEGGVVVEKPKSRLIAEAVMRANGKLSPEIEETLTEIEGDWTVGLPVSDEVVAVLTATGGIGEHASEGVTEADLDALVPPQDELRKAIRVAMGDVFDAKMAIQGLEAQVVVLRDAINASMASLDEVLKQAVTRG